MLEAKSLTYKVGQQVLLSNFSMQFDTGKIYALVGHNGSGKSTLLKLLAKQQPHQQGDVVIEGKSVHQWSNKDFAKRIAYLPQAIPSSDNLSAKEVVSFGRYPWHGLLGRLSQQDHRCIEEAMQLTNTEVFGERQVDSLSGGERQRVWLAMLLAQKSRFLLLDEPLSALDIGHQIEVLNLIKRLSVELGIGVIIVIHDINMAARFCDHIIALRQGEAIVNGKTDEVFTESKLSQIYNINMRICQHPAGYPVAMPC